MMNGCVPEWTLVSEAGPPHQKVCYHHHHHLLDSHEVHAPDVHLAAEPGAVHHQWHGAQQEDCEEHCSRTDDDFSTRPMETGGCLVSEVYILQILQFISLIRLLFPQLCKANNFTF